MALCLAELNTLQVSRLQLELLQGEYAVAYMQCPSLHLARGSLCSLPHELPTITHLSLPFGAAVPMPGWYLNAATEALQEASLCPPLSYSPGYGRIRNCLRCQSGTVENPTGTLFVNSPADLSNSTLKLRVDRFAVCREYQTSDSSQPASVAMLPGAFSHCLDHTMMLHVNTGYHVWHSALARSACCCIS